MPLFRCQRDTIECQKVFVTKNIKLTLIKAKLPLEKKLSTKGFFVRKDHFAAG